MNGAKKNHQPQNVLYSPFSCDYLCVLLVKVNLNNYSIASSLIPKVNDVKIPTHATTFEFIRHFRKLSQHLMESYMSSVEDISAISDSLQLFMFFASFVELVLIKRNPVNMPRIIIITIQRPIIQHRSFSNCFLAFFIG